MLRQLLIALALPERRSRELTALFTLALVVVAVPVGVFVASMSWNGDVPPALETAASVLSYTPFGAAFALPFAAVAEEWDAVWVIGVIAVVTAGLLAALWGWLVRRALTTTGRRAASRERPGLGWFALLPSIVTSPRTQTGWPHARTTSPGPVVVAVSCASD